MFFLPSVLNETKKVDNGNKTAEDSPPPGKKMRTCQRKGPTAGGKGADRTKGKQGNGPGGHGTALGSQLLGLQKNRDDTCSFALRGYN